MGDARNGDTTAGTLTKPAPSTGDTEESRDHEKPETPRALPLHDPIRSLGDAGDGDTAAGTSTGHAPDTGDNVERKDREKPETPRAKSVLPPRQTPKRVLDISPSKSPKKGRRLPPRRVPPNQAATTAEVNAEAGPSKVLKLPPRRVPQNQTAATTGVNAEAGPSRSVIAGIPLVVTENEDLLVLPPILRDIFEELTSLFDDCDSPFEGPETSDEESKRHKFGWPDE